MTAKHEPTDQLRGKVEALSQYGIPRDQIACSIGISEPTLRKHYSEQLTRGKFRANKAVAENLFNIASGAKGTVKEQVTAGIFWAKTQMGWRETVDVNHTIDSEGAAERLLAEVNRMLAQSAEPGALDAVVAAPGERLN